LTGFGPTAAGYFLQGAFKFGGYELFKQQSINLLVRPIRFLPVYTLMKHLGL
jgi:hypothetical protein